MKLLLLPVAVILAFTGCPAPDSETESRSKQMDTPARAAAPPPKDPLSWQDRAVMRYINESGNGIIADARMRGRGEDWIVDRDETRDSTNYLVIHIGHDESEPDGTNRRFATDAWLYLDTVRKRIYEYDLPNDSLVFWK
jgi:hypothetical protein